MTSLPTLLLWVLGTASPSPAADAPLPSVDLPAPVARVLRDYEEAWRRKDAAALAALFAEDGFVLANGRPPVRGRARIEKHYTGAGGPLALRALAFATEGALGYVVGAYASEKGQPDDGKFTLTLRRDAAGRWLIVSDMDNGNTRSRPAASAPANASADAQGHTSAVSDVVEYLHPEADGRVPVAVRKHAQMYFLYRQDESFERSLTLLRTALAEKRAVHVTFLTFSGGILAVEWAPAEAVR